MYRALKRIVMGTTLALVGAALYVPLQGSTTWELGDLFVGVGNGQFQLLTNSGAFKENLPAGGTGDTAGCGLDASLNAHLVNTTQFKIFKRALALPHNLLQTIDTDANPQSIVFAANGDFYVGHLGGLIRRYIVNQTTGVATQAESTVVATDSTDSFWLDMAADQRTLFYTSGGRTIRRVTVDINPSTNAATFGVASLFATLPSPNSNAARALRLLPPGTGAGNDAIISGLVVADKGNIKLLNASGSVDREYDAGTSSLSQDDWFALALDITDVDEAGEDRAFWAGDKSSGNLWRFNLLSSTPTTGPIPTGALGSLRGLCLNGEPTTGQYSRLLQFDPAMMGTINQTATFAAGTPAFEEHALSVLLDSTQVPLGGLRAVVNAREAKSDGICTGGNAANRSDIDCGFVTHFSNFLDSFENPILPVAAPYAHRRGAYYHVRWLTPGTPPEVVVRISSDRKLSDVMTDLAAVAPACTYTWPNTTTIVTTPRALRILRDPSITVPDDFEQDLTDAFYIDEWGTSSIRTNRFIIAARCATGTSQIKKPAPSRTFKAGNSIPIEVILKNGLGNPITDATMDPHNIVATVGFAGQVLFVIDQVPGSSSPFFNQIQPGTYTANLQTTGLAASSLPYNFCISDRRDPPNAAEAPYYQQSCLEFFLK